MRWRRMEALKPEAERRPEPVRPTTMVRPTDVNHTEEVIKWSAAAKVSSEDIDFCFALFFSFN
jgi:hypothetical protein